MKNETEFQRMLRELIERSGYSGKVFAGLLESQESSLEKWLNGQYRPALIVQQYIKVLHTRPELVGLLAAFHLERTGHPPEGRKRRSWRRKAKEAEGAVKEPKPPAPEVLPQ